MVNFTYERLASLQGAEVYDRMGEKLGKLGQFYTDHTGQPTWASVKTGWFGLNESLVPLQGAQFEGEGVQLPYDQETVKDAPNVNIDADEPLTSEEVASLYRHYQFDWDDSRAAYQAGVTDTAHSYETTPQFSDSLDAEAGTYAEGDPTPQYAEHGGARPQFGTRLRRFVRPDHPSQRQP
jgi:sporulation protein YlmC with PRC-barrel domain